MSSVDGANATPASQPGEKQKALCVATRCTSVEQFVATFHRFCDETSFFVATLATRPVGLETAFSIQLEDKTPVLRGLCVVVEAWSTPANRFGRPGVRLDVRRLTNDSITVFKQLQQARLAAEASQPATAPQKAMHDPAAAQAAFDNAANAALDLVASEAAAAAKESKAALEAAAKRAMTEAEAEAAEPPAVVVSSSAVASSSQATMSPASSNAKADPPPLMPKGTRDGLTSPGPKATQAIGALLKTPATPASGTPTAKAPATPALGTSTAKAPPTPALGTPTKPPPTPALGTPAGKPLVTNAFPVSASSNSSDAPAIAAKQTKQMPPMPANKFSQALPKLKDGATPPVGSPTAPPPLPGSMRVTPPTAIPVVRAVPDVAKIESVKLRAEGTAPVTKETIAANAQAASDSAKATVAAKPRAESETTDVEAESFDEKTVDVQNKLTAVVELTSAQAKRRPGTDAKSLAERSAKPSFDIGPVLSSTLETGPIARVGLETGPIPRATLDSVPSSFDIAPITSSTLETGPIRRPTLESGPIATPLAAKSTSVEKKVINPGAPKAPEETRTPGSSFVLPANPLMNLTDASLEGFIDCALYEETGNFYRAEDPGLVDVGDLVQPPLPNQLSPIQALRPGDVSDRQPSYIGPMPNQHSYMGQMPTGGTYPPPYSTQPPPYSTQPPPYSMPTGQMAPLRGSSTTPMPLGPNDMNVTFGQNANGLSPTAFNARRAQSELFAPEQTPIPMLLGPGYAQQLEDAARDAASTTPPPFGPPETRTNWARAQTPDPSRDTPLSYARVEMNPQGRIDTQPLILLPDGSAQPARPSTITQDMQRSTGQTPPLPRDYNSGGFSPQRGGGFSPQRGGRFATGQFPPQPLSSSAPEVAPGTHPLVGPQSEQHAQHAQSEQYPQPSYPQQYEQQPYAQHQYPQQQYGQQQYAPPNPAMHAASLPSTPLTPRPHRERTQITSAVNPRRWMVIAGSAAVATVAIVTIVLLATRDDKKSAVAATAPTTKLPTSGPQKIDSNVAKPKSDNNAGVAVVKPRESKPATKPPEAKISTSNDATVAHAETKVAPKEEPKVEEPKTDDGEDTTESDAPPVVGNGPCRMEIATTPAGSIVKVDDHAIGPSPVTVAGACKKTKIEVNHARYAAATKWVSPTEGTPATVDVQLSRPTHAVTVTSSPAGATVSIGGRRAGTTPTSVSLMGFTTLTLTFEKKGYGTVTQKFYSKKDNDRVTVTMKKGK